MKKILLIVLKLGLSIGFISYLFLKKIDVAQMIECCRHANLVYLISAYLIILGLIFVGIIRWNIVLAVQDIILRFFTIVRVYGMGLFLNLFMPGLTGGDIFKMYYIARLTHKKLEGGTTVLIDRFVGIFGLVTVVFIGIILTPKDSPLSMIAIPAALTFFGFIIACFVLGNKKVINLIPLLNRILSSFPTLKQRLSRIYNTFYSFCINPRAFVKILLISVCIHPLFAVTGYLIAKSIGITEVPFAYYFVILPAIAFVSALPISVSGWGIGEALYVSLFGLFGVDPVKAVSLSIMFKCIYIFWVVIFGIGFLLPHPKTHAQLNTHADDADLNGLTQISLSKN